MTHYPFSGNLPGGSMRCLFFQGLMGLFFCFAAMSHAHGQISQADQLADSISSLPVAQPRPQIDSALQTFVSQQTALTQQRMNLVAQGASPAELEAWYQQNASLFSLQRQRADALATASALQPILIVQQANIPVNASATLKNYLASQVALSNARAQIHNQMVTALPAAPTATQINKMQQAETQFVQKQRLGDLQLQAQQSQALALETARTPLPLPRVPKVSANTSPQMAAFQTQLYQFRLGRAQIWNNNLNADPAARAKALQAWREQNISQLKQIQQQALGMAKQASTIQDVGE